jgi:hypothetical protein
MKMGYYVKSGERYFFSIDLNRLDSSLVKKIEFNLLPLLHGPYLKKNDFYVTAPREI